MLKENIPLASVQALGVIGRFTVGVFQTDQKIYQRNEFQGKFEMVSFIGTINTMNHGFYCHLHINAGNDKSEISNGRLNQAIVSATCEMVISIVNGDVDRC